MVKLTSCGRYVVEKILNHLVDDEDGTIKYEVKWAGFEKKSDRTWEPEENLYNSFTTAVRFSANKFIRVTAPEVLTAYLSKVGGKEAIIAEWEEKKGSASEPKGRKRGRSSVGANGGEAPKKKGRKSHPASSTPPASAKQEFKPPTGSWEEDVIGIDACEGPKGDVLVYLTWKGQHKTQHPLSQVYKRCPQRVRFSTYS
jgi:chromobox protein 1